MAGHTPGPWTVSRVGVGFEVESADGAMVAQTQAVAPPSPEAHHIRRANARLIAAAPDLLDALEAFVAVLDAWLPGDGIADLYDAGQAARAALAKAEKGA